MLRVFNPNVLECIVSRCVRLELHLAAFDLHQRPQAFVLLHYQVSEISLSVITGQCSGAFVGFCREQWFQNLKTCEAEYSTRLKLVISC